MLRGILNGLLVSALLLLPVVSEGAEGKSVGSDLVDETLLRLGLRDESHADYEQAPVIQNEEFVDASEVTLLREEAKKVEVNDIDGSGIISFYDERVESKSRVKVSVMIDKDGVFGFKQEKAETGVDASITVNVNAKGTLEFSDGVERVNESERPAMNMDKKGTVTFEDGLRGRKKAVPSKISMDKNGVVDFSGEEE